MAESLAVPRLSAVFTSVMEMGHKSLNRITKQNIFGSCASMSYEYMGLETVAHYVLKRIRNDSKALRRKVFGHVSFSPIQDKNRRFLTKASIFASSLFSHFDGSIFRRL
ncbi:MAG: hypothetical protein Q4C45_03545 [Oscillospiraceae bacterium]|nr:hypothetical protein [Oscillospiraceae bacterium]